MTTFEQPRKGDIDRALSQIMHTARHKVQAEVGRIQVEAAARGVTGVQVVLAPAIVFADDTHKAAILDAQRVLRDFAERMSVGSSEIVGWARPHLENLGNSILGAIKPSGFPSERQRFVHQYQAVFNQRMEGALRDVQIGFVKEDGFSARVTMPEQEEWITSAAALTLLRNHEVAATRTICTRAHAGLVKARAARFVRDGKPSDNVDVPEEFWWAEGAPALTQRWASGDFETWINNSIRLQAFGVTFRRSDIEKLIPAPSAGGKVPAIGQAKATGGRPKAAWSDDLWIEMCRQLYAGELIPKKPGDITKAMMDWLSTRGEEPGESTVKERARKLWAAIGDLDGN